MEINLGNNIPVYFEADTAKANVAIWAKQIVDQLNTIAIGWWLNVVEGYNNTIARNKELGIPLPIKPTPPLKAIVVTDSNGFASYGYGSELVASPIPDPTPITPVIPGLVINIGIELKDPWYSCGIGDNAPMGYLATKDGIVYRKDPGIFGLPHYTKVS